MLPAGVKTCLMCHTFLSVQETQGWEKKVSESKDRLCSPSTVLQSYGLGQRSSQHGTEPSPEPTRGLQQHAKCFSRNRTVLSPGEGKENPASGRSTLFDGLYWPEPSSSSGKGFPAGCTAGPSGCVCPCIQKQATFHTDGQYWGIGQWATQSLDRKKLHWHNRQWASSLQPWDQHLHSATLTTNRQHLKTRSSHLWLPQSFKKMFNYHDS